MSGGAYHEIYVPLPDVYVMGGPKTFDELQCKKEDKKNLIIMPWSVIKELQERKLEGYAGAEHVLRTISGLNPSEIEAIKRKKDKKDLAARIYSLGKQLDVMVLDEGHSTTLDKSMNELEHRVKQHLSIEGVKYTVLTNEETHRIKFNLRGVKVEEPRFLQVGQDIVNEGIVLGNDALLAELQDQKNNNTVSIERAGELLKREDLRLNQFVKFMADEKRTFYARIEGDLARNSNGRVVDVRNKRLRWLDHTEQGRVMRVGNHQMRDVLGVKPLDMEQYLALQYGLLNPDVELFFLCGSQGSGKTLLSYVAAMDQILHYDQRLRQMRGTPKNEDAFYRQAALLKSNELIGGSRRDVGFLPGTLYEKLKPHLEPYVDAHKESLFGKLLPFDAMLRHPKYQNDFGPPRDKDHSNTKINDAAHLPPHWEVLELPYSGFVRGRTFPHKFVLLDEAQNWTPYEVKTLIERTGVGCKLVIMGDPLQVDNPMCSRGINGLTHAIHHFLDKPYAALVTLSRNYRSPMSEDARDWKVYST